ncbi:MAG: hypothetical protein IT356_03005 [Gemmatimonadaceae bacterium]|nr:hypothetical protein [Gemmatimonadaceae bacterium]
MLAWVGDALARPTRHRPIGLSSGTEFLVAGLLVGPVGVGMVTRTTLEALAPLTLVAASWLALLAGSDIADRRNTPPSRVVMGLALGLASYAACSVAAWLLMPVAAPLDGEARVLMALGMGCAGSETARIAMTWGATRPAVRGPLQNALADLAAAGDVVPLIGLAVLFSIAPQPTESRLNGFPLIALGVTVGLGVVAGVLAAVLTRVESRQTERWGILVGAALMGVGLCAALGLAAPTALATMAVVLNLLARDRAALRAMLASTARPVLLPVMALAGAQIDAHDGKAFWLAVALVPLVRLGIKLPVVAVLRRGLAPSTAMTRWAGAALMSAGPVTACVGLVVAARLPGPIGRLVLASCVASIIAGEVVGLPARRRELRRAGEGSSRRETPAPDAKVVT